MSTVVAHKTRVMRHKGITLEQVREALVNAVRVAIPGNSARQRAIRESIIDDIKIVDGFESVVTSFTGVPSQVHIRVPTRKLIEGMGRTLVAAVGYNGGVRLEKDGSVSFNLDHFGIESEAERFNRMFACELAVVDAAQTLGVTQDEARKLMKEHRLDPDKMTEKDARRVRMASTLAAEFKLGFDEAFELVKRVRNVKLEDESDVAAFREALTTLDANLPWIELEHLARLFKQLRVTKTSMHRLPLVRNNAVESIIPDSVIHGDFVVDFGNNRKVVFRQVETEVEADGKKTKHKVWQIVGPKTVMEEVKPALAELRRIVSAWQPISQGLEHLKESKVVPAVELEVSRGDEGSVSVQLVGLDAEELQQREQFVAGLRDRAKKGDQKSQQMLRERRSHPEPISLTYTIATAKGQAFERLAQQAAVAWQREG